MEFLITASAPFDWLDVEWTGGADEEELTLCGLQWCEDCSICTAARAAIKRIFLPIYGPVNEDGVPLGFLLVSE